MARKRRKKAAPATNGRLDAEMKYLGKRLDEVKAAARKTEASVRAVSARQLDMLRRKQTEAKRAVAKLGRRSAAASGPMKTGLRKAWLDIESALRQASKRFRETR